VPCDLKEGTRQGFTSGSLQGRITAALFLLFFDGPDKAFRNIPLGRGTDPRFLLLGVEIELLIELLEAATQAFHHLLGFLADVSQLTIGEAGEICDKDLAVIPQGQKGGSDIAAAGIGVAAQGTVRGNGTGGTTAAGHPPRITYKCSRRLRAERHLKQPYKQQNLEQKDI